MKSPWIGPLYRESLGSIPFQFLNLLGLLRPQLWWPPGWLTGKPPLGTGGAGIAKSAQISRPDILRKSFAEIKIIDGFQILVNFDQMIKNYTFFIENFDLILKSLKSSFLQIRKAVSYKAKTKFLNKKWKSLIIILGEI